MAHVYVETELFEDFAEDIKTAQNMGVGLESDFEIEIQRSVVTTRLQDSDNKRIFKTAGVRAGELDTWIVKCWGHGAINALTVKTDAVKKPQSAHHVRCATAAEAIEVAYEICRTLGEEKKIPLACFFGKTGRDYRQTIETKTGANSSAAGEIGKAAGVLRMIEKVLDIGDRMEKKGEKVVYVADKLASQFTGSLNLAEVNEDGYIDLYIPGLAEVRLIDGIAEGEFFDRDEVVAVAEKLSRKVAGFLNG